MSENHEGNRRFQSPQKDETAENTQFLYSHHFVPYMCIGSILGEAWPGGNPPVPPGMHVYVLSVCYRDREKCLYFWGKVNLGLLASSIK
jgi:hypothetical protein